MIAGPAWAHVRRRGKDERKGFTETGYARLLDAAHQQLGAPPGGRVGQLQHPRQPRDDRPDRGAGLADGLPAPAVGARAQPGLAGLGTPERSLASLAKRNLAQLTALIKTRLRRMQDRPGLLDGFLASTGLDLAL